LDLPLGINVYQTTIYSVNFSDISGNSLWGLRRIQLSGFCAHKLYTFIRSVLRYYGFFIRRYKRDNTAHELVPNLPEWPRATTFENKKKILISTANLESPGVLTAFSKWEYPRIASTNLDYRETTIPNAWFVRFAVFEIITINERVNGISIIYMYIDYLQLF